MDETLEFHCIVNDDHYVEGHKLLLVTHNGYQWSSVAFYNRDEAIDAVWAILSAFEISPKEIENEGI